MAEVRLWIDDRAIGCGLRVDDERPGRCRRRLLLRRNRRLRERHGGGGSEKKSDGDAEDLHKGPIKKVLEVWAKRRVANGVAARRSAREAECSMVIRRSSFSFAFFAAVRLPKASRCARLLVRR